MSAPPPYQDGSYQQAPLLSTPPLAAQPQQQIVYVNVPGEEDASCAQAGCFFSWIPIVGCVNYCVNSSAPEHSKRRKLAQTSCAIALVVFLIKSLSFQLRGSLFSFKGHTPFPSHSGPTASQSAIIIRMKKTCIDIT